MSSTFNREFTNEERGRLRLFAQLISSIYREIFPVAQLAEAGNNSQSYHPESGVIMIGTENEPYFLHEHIWGRGYPDHDYIPGVPLDGPPLGEEFHMKGNTADVKGNEGKVQWTKEQQLCVVTKLREEIGKRQGAFRKTDLKVYR